MQGKQWDVTIKLKFDAEHFHSAYGNRLMSSILLDVDNFSFFRYLLLPTRESVIL